MIGRKYNNFLWRYGNILFYSQIVHDSGLSWKLHLKAKYTGFDKWKYSWSKVAINTRFTLAKSHGKPKNNEYIGGGRGRSILSPTWFFQECAIYIEGIAVLISHIFRENFIEIPQVLQNIWRFSPSILTFSLIFGFFEISLLQRN